MKQRQLFKALLSTCLFLLAIECHAQGSRVVSFQALVVDEKSQIPLDTTQCQVLASLSDDSLGLHVTWSDVFTVPIRHGVLSLYLGSHQPLPDPAVLDASIYLTVRVGDRSIFTSTLSAAALALNVVDASITAPKIAADYVASVSVDGKRMAKRAADLTIKQGEGIRIEIDDTSSTLTISAPPLASPGNIPGTSTPADYWGEYGNSLGSSNSSGKYVGTNSNDDFNLVVAGSRAVSYQNAGSYAPNIVAGYYTNTITGGVRGSTIGGGGEQLYENKIGSHFGVIGGGISNKIFGAGSFASEYCVIGGGQGNKITTEIAGAASQNLDEGTKWHFLGGGDSNQILIDIASGTENPWLGASTLVGGRKNVLCAPFGFIGGGENNMISSTDPASDDDLGHAMRWDVIVGGQSNRITHYSKWSIIAGG